MWKLRKLKEKVENSILKLSEVEIKVREATNDDSSYPTSNVLRELSEMSYNYRYFEELMDSLWSRMRSPSSSWLYVYKSLLVIDYILKFGSERVIENVKSNLHFLKSLTINVYVDSDNKNQSKNIHHRANQIIDLVSNDAGLEDSRRNARILLEKVQANYCSKGSEIVEPVDTETFQSKSIKFLMNVKNILVKEEQDEDIKRQFTSYNEPSNPSFTKKKLSSYEDSTNKFPKFQPERTTSLEVPDIKNPSQTQSLSDLLDFSEFSNRNPEKQIISGEFDLFSSVTKESNNNFAMSDFISCTNQTTTEFSPFVEPPNNPNGNTVDLMYTNSFAPERNVSSQNLFDFSYGTSNNQNSGSIPPTLSSQIDFGYQSHPQQNVVPTPRDGVIHNFDSINMAFSHPVQPSFRPATLHQVPNINSRQDFHLKFPSTQSNDVSSMMSMNIQNLFSQTSTPATNISNIRPSLNQIPTATHHSNVFNHRENTNQPRFF